MSCRVKYPLQGILKIPCCNQLAITPKKVISQVEDISSTPIKHIPVFRCQWYHVPIFRPFCQTAKKLLNQLYIKYTHAHSRVKSQCFNNWQTILLRFKW